VLLCGRPRIDVADLPRSITGLGLAIAPGPTEPGSAAVAFDPSLHRRPLREARREALRSFTRAYLAEQLRATGGRIGETARLAGIGERSLHALMKRYGLDKDVFRERRSEVRTPIDVADSPRSR